MTTPKEVRDLAQVLSGMTECGPAPDDLWERDQPDGDPFVARAVEVLKEHATMLVLEPTTQAARDVLAERRRQIEAEGWTPEHDARWRDEGELSAAASAYAVAASDLLNPMSQGDGQFDAENPPPAWPPEWMFKVGDPRRMLVKAGALILAEIERLDRAAPR